MTECEVIGGAADGERVTTTPKIVVTMTIKGDRYIAIQFKASNGLQGNLRKDVDHYAYMLCGMAPAEAIKLWKVRCKRYDR